MPQDIAIRDALVVAGCDACQWSARAPPSEHRDAEPGEQAPQWVEEC